MTITLEYLNEPKLQFGQYFECEDPKTGLKYHGPFGKNIEGLHKREIHLGFVGTRATISIAKSWIDRCSEEIESENVKTINIGKYNAKVGSGPVLFEFQEQESKLRRIYKIINPDFIGFSHASSFDTKFVLNTRWDKAVVVKEINAILELDNKHERILQLVELFSSQVETLATNSPSPDIVIIALDDKIFELADTVRVSGNFYYNLRRALKAKCMKWGVPIQLLLSSTVTDSKSSRKDLQEIATRAWNFCTAQYFKADGVPWIPLTLDKDTCYIGIDFYVCRDSDESLTLKTSVAQAFDHLGQGLILRSDDPFEWNSMQNGRSPHMTYDIARKLIAKTLKEYMKAKGVPPKRVVIHKSSRFWGRSHETYNEIDGLNHGIEEVVPCCQTDFLTLLPSGLRLFREGQYPPLRGTLAKLHDKHFLYTMGYIPYFETYPSSHVPIPWEIAEHYGDSTINELANEILELTKMNVNNCSFADGIPITLAFSEKVGEIMKHLSADEDKPATKYKFYM